MAKVASERTKRTLPRPRTARLVAKIPSVQSAESNGRMQDRGDPLKARLRAFDRASARQARRQGKQVATTAAADRGWVREDLYVRGGAR